MGSRGWCFTLHKQDGEDHKDEEEKTYFHPQVNHASVIYAVWQEEECPDTGRIHLQGYLYFGDKKPRMKWVKATIFPKSRHVHLKPANGSPEDNHTYCTKEESRVDGPWEKGEMPKGQGERTDIKEFTQAVIATRGDIRDLDEKYDHMMLRYSRHAQSLMGHVAAREAKQAGVPVIREPLKVKIYWGEAGAGKTWAAQHDHKDVYTLAEYKKDKLWFDGYIAHKTLLIDEFDPENMPITVFNQICDRYPYNCPVKGGFVPARWDTVVICSNIDPQSWYTTADRKLRNAFIRRVTEIKHFVKPAEEAEEELSLPAAQVVVAGSGARAEPAGSQSDPINIE